MHSTSISPVAVGWRCRACGFVLALVMVLAPALATAQDPAAPAPAQPAQPAQQQAAPGRTFSADGGMIFNIIKPDKTADFEMVMGRLKEALAGSEDPQKQKMAEGWKVFRSVEPGPNGNVLYLWIMDPVVPGADYTVSKILSEAFPTEVQELYTKFSESYASGQNLVNLRLVSDFGSGGASTGGMSAPAAPSMTPPPAAPPAAPPPTTPPPQ